jgi:hypothetical protein
MSLLEIDLYEFLTNQFVKNLCPFIIAYEIYVPKSGVALSIL